MTVTTMRDDLISRAAAVDALDHLDYTPGEWNVKGLTMCKDAIKALPPVDAVLVVHGHWNDIDTETYTWKIRCSRCGHERSMMSTGKIYPMYCENCGARMD